jgi:hypothetical protein
VKGATSSTSGLLPGSLAITKHCNGLLIIIMEALFMKYMSRRAMMNCRPMLRQHIYRLVANQEGTKLLSLGSIYNNNIKKSSLKNVNRFSKMK